VENPYRRIFNPGFAGLPFNGKPDIMRNLGREPMERKDRNKAYHAVRNQLRDLREVDFCRHFHVGELIQASGHRNQKAFIPKPVKGPFDGCPVPGLPWSATGRPCS